MKSVNASQAKAATSPAKTALSPARVLRSPAKASPSPAAPPAASVLLRPSPSDSVEAMDTADMSDSVMLSVADSLHDHAPSVQSLLTSRHSSLTMIQTCLSALQQQLNQRQCVALTVNAGGAATTNSADVNSGDASRPSPNNVAATATQLSQGIRRCCSCAVTSASDTSRLAWSDAVTALNALDELITCGDVTGDSQVVRPDVFVSAINRVDSCYCMLSVT